MKLYYAPNACSLAPHIVLRELGLSFELIRVDNRTKRTADDRSFYDVTPKGYVAALLLDNGSVLTEGPAIIQYLADLKPEAGLAPINGTWERVRLQEWLNFISSEIHAGSAPLFSADIPDSIKALFRDKLCKRLDFIADALRERPFLLGEAFGVADAYLYTVLTWMSGFSIDLCNWPSLSTFMERVGVRPSVAAALSAETTSRAVNAPH